MIDGDVTLDALRLAATARCGLDHFGDPASGEALGAWCEDLRSGVLTDEGRAYLARQAVHDLVRRLRIINALGRHPEVEAATIPPIVWIVGPPRSGTTLLHNLLALHAGARPLLRWELVDPVPLEHPVTGTDPRIEAEQRRVERLRGTDLERMHWVEAEDPEECGWGLYDGAGILGQGFLHALSTYRHHLRSEHDWVRSFLEYRRLVQLLLWQRPAPDGGFLVLKAPQFVHELPTLQAVFPEARFVITHRDPYRTLTSTIAILGSLASGVVRDDLPEPPGADPLADCLGTIDSLQRFAGESTTPVVHVRYADLLADPSAVCERVLTGVGREPDPNLARAIGTFLAAQRAGRRAAPPRELPTTPYDHDEIWDLPEVRRYVAAVGLEPEGRRLTDVAAPPVEPA